MDSFLEKSTSYVKVLPPENPIPLKGFHFFMGSCFAENLFTYFYERYLNCTFSPFGNIYNPLSLAGSIHLLCSEEPISDNSLFQHRELWCHFDFDSELSAPSRSVYLNRLNRSLEKGRAEIRRTTHLYLTLGTSFVYRLKESGKPVNNCHKLPDTLFSRECASISEMRDELIGAFSALDMINPALKIIITLSPVRHLRDNPVENSLSKARLRCLIDELMKEREIWYFPAYEILLDQLRDYRWYGPDLAHPSPQAVEYIMERFVEAAADKDLQICLKKMSRLRNRENHRILHPDTAEAEKFIRSTSELFRISAAEYPYLKRLQEASEKYVQNH